MSGISAILSKGLENDGYCGAGTCGDLTYHGGPVMHNALVVPVFWGGPTVNSACTANVGIFDNSAIDPTASNPNDCTYASISARFITDFCASAPNAFFANINQYTDGSGSLGSCSDQPGAYSWYWDFDAFPANPMSDGQLQSEANGVRSTLGLGADLSTIILMFTPYGEGSCASGVGCFPTGQFCAYHSWAWTGVPLVSSTFIYASLPDYGWAGSGCGLGGPSPNNDPFGDLVVTGVDHESSESFTDPLPGKPCFLCSNDGWYYQDTKHENGDECNFDMVGTEPFDGSNMRLGASGSAGDPFRAQSEWSNAVNGCTIDVNGSPVPVFDMLTPDSSSGTRAQSWSFNVLMREAGETTPAFTCGNCANTASWPFSTTTTFYVTPNDNFYTEPSAASNFHFCFDVGCNSQVVTPGFAGASVFYYYYELLREDPYMNVIDGGSPPGVSISYTTAPSCGNSCSGASDTTQVLSAGLPATIYAVWGSTGYVPTCDPQGIHFNGFVFTPYCGTNFGAIPSERWDTGIASTCGFFFLCSTAEAVSFIDSITTINYWHQLLLDDSYSISGGGSPTAPSIFYTAFGGGTSNVISTSGTFFWADSGTAWSITNPLVGSSSTERWETNSLVSGIATASTTESLTYFNQFLFTLNYVIKDGGSGVSAPVLTSTKFGAAFTPSLTTVASPYWLDNGKAWKVNSPLGGSTASQRWQAPPSTVLSGTVTATQTKVFTYYHQYFVAASFFVSDGSTGYTANPSLVASLFGASLTTPLTTTPSSLWLDAAHWASSPQLLLGSTSTQRWYATTNTGVVSGAAINVKYFHQYWVVFSVAPVGSGSTSPTGWYNANAVDTIHATPAAGWILSSWTTTGGITITGGQTPTTTMKVTGTGTVTATFKPNVVLTLSSTSLTIAHGGSAIDTATIKGSPQSVTLSYSSTTVGITATFATDPITDSVAGVTDAVTIHVASTVAAGTYHITISATGADGVVSKVTITVKVT